MLEPSCQLPTPTHFPFKSTGFFEKQISPTLTGPSHYWGVRKQRSLNPTSAREEYTAGKEKVEPESLILNCISSDSSHQF